MGIRINDTAPNFTAQTTEGEIDFHDWIGDSWAVLFSHPKNFTPVCTTELGYMARLKPEFEKRNTKIIGLSIDPEAIQRIFPPFAGLPGAVLEVGDAEALSLLVVVHLPDIDGAVVGTDLLCVLQARTRRPGCNDACLARHGARGVARGFMMFGTLHLMIEVMLPVSLLVGAGAVPSLAAAFGRPGWEVGIACSVCGVVVLRHWSNIKRLVTGKEAAVVGRSGK